MATQVQAIVPSAKVSYAHGQMSERELENIMHEFIEGQIDVLVCTTIIETGLDIPNVNTIIIQDADHMGLSQLHQLRGRVGRSARNSFAYLMYQKDKVLTEQAEKRLRTIRDFTEFGAGFKISMRDLEIRGAGNLLGAEQHGHMDSIGYDMYCKLLAQAVGALKGEEVEEAFETSIDVKLDAYIPDYYIENEELKLEIYKKISLIRAEEDFFDVQEEIEDRFGDLPASVQNLLDVALVKGFANRIGIASVTERSENFVLEFKDDPKLDPQRLVALLSENAGKIFFTNAQAGIRRGYLTIKSDSLRNIKNILHRLND